MINYLLICRSLTYAQRVAKALENSGISAVVMRTPYEISSQGCGYSVKISEKRFSQAIVVLKAAGLSPLKVYTLYSDGHVMEAKGK